MQEPTALDALAKLVRVSPMILHAIVLTIFLPLALGAFCLSPLTYFQLLGRLYYRCQQAVGLSR